MKEMLHLRSETVEKYSFRRLTGDEEAQVEEHLLVCDKCRNRLDEFEAFVHAVRQGSSKVTVSASGN